MMDRHFKFSHHVLPDILIGYAPIIKAPGRLDENPISL
jgi:hypothetical protein